MAKRKKVEKLNAGWKEILKQMLFVIIILVIIGGSFLWAYMQWKECKTMGFSTFYCLQHAL